MNGLDLLRRGTGELPDIIFVRQFDSFYGVMWHIEARHKNGLKPVLEIINKDAMSALGDEIRSAGYQIGKRGQSYEVYAMPIITYTLPDLEGITDA